jgi:hypothetical protein
MQVTAYNISIRRLSKMVDELGALNAQINMLQRKADAIKETLKSTDHDEVYGQSYRAVISTRTTARLDTALVREILKPAQIDACTKESTSTSISLYDL